MGETKNETLVNWFATYSLCRVDFTDLFPKISKNSWRMSDGRTSIDD